ISCASAEQLAPIGTITSANLDTYLDLIKPTGWTPMGLAISNAQASFVGKEQDNNEIVLVTDGDETCDSNPVGAATSIFASTAKVKVNIIAFAVSSKEVTTLSAIARAGSGSFASANNSDELIARMNDLYENLKNIKDEKICQGEKSISFLNCYADTNRKVYEFVGTLKRRFYQKQISKAEFDRLDKLETAIWDQGQKANKE
ncbi:MAG: D-amino acid dehydrogenase large subunit, partial [Candidatus Roizmanbacteria bacterium GW2011_GWA2_34_18]